MDRGKKRALSPSAVALAKKQKLDGDSNDNRIIQEAMARIRARHRSETERDEIHKSNAINSPLLRLPAELRNMIFGWVYYDVLYILSEYYRSYENVVYMHVDDCPGSYTPHDLGLLLVCRQIYAETALLPYSLGSFYVWAEFLDIDEQVYALDRFLKARTQEQIGAILSLKFDEFHKVSLGIKPLEETGAFWVAKLAEESYQDMISSLIIVYPTVWTLDREMAR